MPLPTRRLGRTPARNPIPRARRFAPSGGASESLPPRDIATRALLAVARPTRAMASPSPSPLLASLRRAAAAAWVASGGPLVDEATAAMAEAHSLQLCLLGLQHEISEMSTGAAEPTPSCESVEAKAEAEAEVEAEAEAGDGPVASQLFEGHQVLDGGGFRTLQHAFATHEECAQVACTRHAHTMHAGAHALHTPCDSPCASRCARRQRWAWSRAFVAAARRPCPSHPSCARGWTDAVPLRPCRVSRR